MNAHYSGKNLTGDDNFGKLGTVHNLGNFGSSNFILRIVHVLNGFVNDDIKLR